MDARKQAIIAALERWIKQRPGLEFGNYGDVANYRSEMRSITKDLHHARTLLSAVQWRDSITADDLIEAAHHAYSGRLTLTVSPHPCAPDGCTTNMVAKIDYCTGQYWPTEYRRAVCAVLAYALWDYTRDKAMPAPIVENGETYYPKGKRNVSAGDWLRSHFRREFGHHLAQRWFA